jgi:HEAT repeat protein
MSELVDFETLLSTLKSESGIRQRYAVQSLGRSGDPRAVEPLIGVLLSSKREMQVLAARALAKLGAPSVRPLVRLLGQEQGEVWPLASAALVMVGYAAIPVLLGALREENENQQLLIIGILGQIGDARAVESLTDALASENSAIYTAAAVALARIGEPSVQSLFNLLTQFDKPELRRRAHEILKQIGESAIPLLLHKLYTGSYLERTQAGWMLSEIGNPCLDALLQAMSHKDDYVRYTAATALGNIGSATAVPRLIEALADTAYSRAAGNPVCHAAARSLEQIDTAEARIALAEWRKQTKP